VSERAREREREKKKERRIKFNININLKAAEQGLPFYFGFSPLALIS